MAEEGLAKAFLARPNAEGVYSVDLPGGGRTRVVLDDDQREVLARLKRLQGLRGRAKDDAVLFLCLQTLDCGQEPRECLCHLLHRWPELALQLLT